jgi:predicted nucleic acid-binding Zn ribbon protein
MMLLSLAGIALLFFVIICGPNILIESMARHRAKVTGVEYEPICKPIKSKCPECGSMVEEDYGFCERCGGMLAKEIRREIPVNMTVVHDRFT